MRINMLEKLHITHHHPDRLKEIAYFDPSTERDYNTIDHAIFYNDRDYECIELHNKFNQPVFIIVKHDNWRLHSKQIRIYDEHGACIKILQDNGFACSGKVRKRFGKIYTIEMNIDYSLFQENVNRDDFDDFYDYYRHLVRRDV